MEIRAAEIGDWPQLEKFYTRIYRKKHPLQKREFWAWQYSDSNYGRAFIAIGDNRNIVGHVGANFGGGYAWIINVYLDEEYRGKGILSKLYELARQYYPLAATAANAAGLGLYRNMGWYRYYDLQRYVAINPNIANYGGIKDILGPILVEHSLGKPKGHYWEQPGLKSLILPDGSTAINQDKVGGLRAVDINSLESLMDFAWQLGYKWIDYVTSWNDKVCKEMETKEWVIDSLSIIPWRLEPVQIGYMCDITFLSEDPVPRDFIVHRSFSDHGRVGSL